MRVAIPYESGEVFQHFGHTKQFKIYETDKVSVTGASVVDTNGMGHSALAQFLKEQQVDTLICGGIGGGAQEALGAAGIQILGGVSGMADAAIQDFILGKLRHAEDPVCVGHDNGTDSCGCGNHHGGCGHGCH